jgi:hypothetical protein
MSASSEHRPVTVRELLELASTELDDVSRTLSRGRGPDSSDVAQQWPAFRRAAGHFLHALDGRDMGSDGANGVPAHVTRLTRVLDAIEARSGDGTAPENPAPGPITRAASALGAAGDLLRSANLSGLERPDVRAALVAGSALLTAAAQVTAHVSIHDLTTLKIAQEATTVASASADVVLADPLQSTRGTIDAIATRTRPEPRPGDLPRLLEVTTWDWRTAALMAAESAAPSSRDLRAALSGSSQILGMATLVLRAHNQAQQQQLAQLDTPDSQRLRSSTQRSGMEVDRKLRLSMNQLNTASEAWNGYATGTPATPALLTATTNIATTVSLIARDGARWLRPEEIAGRVHPAALVVAARGAVDAVHEVTEAHHALVEDLLRRGYVYGAARQLPKVSSDPRWWSLNEEAQEAMALQRMEQVRAGAWVPVEWGYQSAALMSAYEPLPALTAKARADYWTTTPRTDRSAWHSLLDEVTARGPRTHLSPVRALEGDDVAAASPTSAVAGAGERRVNPARAYAAPLPQGLTRAAVRRGLRDAEQDHHMPKSGAPGAEVRPAPGR